MGESLIVHMKWADESYDEFYRRGGWRYDVAAEWRFIRQQILRQLGIAPPARLLEIGCGQGLHAHLFRRYGFTVTAVDLSPVAVASGLALDPLLDIRCCDAFDLLEASRRGSVDVVFARGMSWFHYELNDGCNRRGTDVGNAMRAISEVLTERGLFVLQIRTNFTGRWDKTGIRHHTFREVVEFFGRYGRIVSLTDWNGTQLSDDASARASGGNVIIAIETSRINRSRCPAVS
jgi:SAM-dependent methyltransferase